MSDFPDTPIAPAGYAPYDPTAEKHHKTAEAHVEVLRRMIKHLKFSDEGLAARNRLEETWLWLQKAIRIDQKARAHDGK